MFFCPPFSTGKRSAQSAHFVESDYGPPFKYADPPEIGER